ncbi:response regulator [Chlorogloeopsis sp. ULAP01]|uniref:response regulator n=1 Tax=Chlorogloeopsis sp. ULAP01 TaxID=3056483 RepID=UPI0025AAE822|nr:response regulator [Chlorogloeopsis sp. ULAP01]MDM9383822.1 response regulator [Chlorogloeopsis sp. ULAP01]
MKILIVEDDEFVAHALAAVLTNYNYAVEIALDGQAAWDLIQTFDYDVILLDVILPRIDGITLCHQIRSHGLRMPILLLTGCDSSHEKAIGLDAGADDYLVKPFNQEELVARIRALLRRGNLISQPILEWGNLQLDPTSCEVTYADKLLSLTPKEYALLELFLRNSRRVFSCGMILEHLWTYEDTPGEEAVRTHIKGLRQKLKAVGASGDLIETVYGIGYRLKPLKEETGEENKGRWGQGEVGNIVDRFSASSQATSTQQQTLQAIAGIWNRFQPRIEAQVTLLEQAASAARQKSLHQKLHKQAQQEAHTLAGSLGTFGYDVGSKLARKIEHLLKANKTLTKDDTTQFVHWVEQLRQEITCNEQKTVSALPSTEQEHPLLLVVDRDRLLAEQIQVESTTKGLEVTIATNIETAKNKLYREHPSVVLLDPSVSSDIEDSFSLLAELKQRKPPVPVVVFTEQSDFTNRLQVARKGGHTFLQKPMPITQVLEAVTQVLQEAPHAEAHILAVDDDPKIGALLQTLLNPWGIKVTTLEDPRRFWETLQTVNPDLLILDVELPQFSGIEICQVVRNDPQWSELPILFLTVHSDADIVNQVFAVGADDFVSKPIIGPELVTRIINRLERIKLRRGMKQSDRFLENEDKLTEEKLNIRISQQATVAQLGLSALLGKELSSLMDEAVTLVAQNLKVEYCKLLKLLPEENTMLLCAGVGWRQGLVGKAKINCDASGSGYTLLVQQPVIIEDLRTETRFQPSFLLQEHRIISGLSVPIPKQNGSYGVLGVYSAKKLTFTERDINFVQSVANILSAALERQHTEQILRQAKDDLELRVAQRTAELTQINEQLQSELNERQYAQSELRNSQAMFVGIVSIADDAIISIDSNQNITLFNQGAEKIFGYEAREVLGQTLDLLIPLRYIKAHRHYVSDFGSSAKVARRMGERREIYGRRKDGTEFPAEASISKLKLGQEIVYTVYLQDISDRKQVERMKDEFVSVVSHELRTPLTSIHGSLGMLASGLIKPESEQGKRLLQIAVDSTERLVRLINDILDIERIESGKVKMEKQTCNVADLIAEAVNVMQPLADKAGVTISVSSLSQQIWADPDRIVQTLTNLLSNAIKFSPTGSTVWLSAEEGTGNRGQGTGDRERGHGEVGTRGGGDKDFSYSPTPPLSPSLHILFTVRDNGRGIPADKLESIFERFQQVDSSDSRNHDGTGLGLAICKSIVQQHGGQIWVDSELGKGSTFYFTIPLSLTSGSSQGTTPTLPYSLFEANTKHLPYSPLVLVCDDDAEVRAQLQNLLEKRHYRVIAVSNGEEAIAAASAQHPDAIVLDLLMPGMNGWETMAILKERADTQNIPIIICSVCGLVNTSQKKQDFVNWVSKPLEESLLFQSLQQALQHSSKLVRVLLVEDDPNLAEVLQTLFEQYNIETFHAKTGREAIHLSQEVNPDLLILDLVLPEGDGFSVVGWLQQHNHLCKIPLMVYSAKELEESERTRLKLGHTEFLNKGQVTPHEFEQRVMMLLHEITQNSAQDGHND